MHGIILDVRPSISFDRRYVTMALRITRVNGGRKPPRMFRFRASVKCLDSDTVLLAGASLPGEDNPRRLIALLTPSVLHLEPVARRKTPAPAARIRPGAKAAPRKKPPQAKKQPEEFVF